ERTPRQLAHYRVGQTTPRHRHQRARDLLGPQLGEQIARTCPRWNGPADAGDHTVHQLVDDLVDREVDPTVLLDVPPRLGQVAAHDRVGVIHAPGATVGLDELELALDPVRLGVDQGAVHVPQNGSRSATGAVGPAGWGSGAPRRLGEEG